MYNMLLIALTRTEQYMCHLRLLTACTLVTHRDHMIEVMKPTAQVLLPQSKQSAASIAKKAENEWLDLLLSTRRSLGKSISPAHTFYSFRKDNLCLWHHVKQTGFNVKGGSCRTLPQQLQPHNCKGFLMPRTSDSATISNIVQLWNNIPHCLDSWMLPTLLQFYQHTQHVLQHSIYSPHLHLDT